jgi:hypothetical protein
LCTKKRKNLTQGTKRKVKFEVLRKKEKWMEKQTLVCLNICRFCLCLSFDSGKATMYTTLSWFYLLQTFKGSYLITRLLQKNQTNIKSIFPPWLLLLLNNLKEQSKQTTNASPKMYFGIQSTFWIFHLFVLL